MKRVLAILVALALVMPMALAVETGTGIGITIETEDFPPLIWMCDHRKVKDDNVEWGRVSEGREELVERHLNYAFEGESIKWLVLVLDKNGIEKIEDVYVSVGPDQGSGQYIEANCVLDTENNGKILDSCNARIDEEKLKDFDPMIMAYYKCLFTVETPASMHGEYWVTANVIDMDGLLGTMDEHEYWFFNPVVALTITGTPLNFGIVRPGTDAYSNTITVGNGAEAGSGVMLDMFISGTDFFDPTHSGAKCPQSNVLRLDRFFYFATNGAYSTHSDEGCDDDWYDPAAQRTEDDEGYVNIQWGNSFSRDMYNEAEIIQDGPMGPTCDPETYWQGNLLSPGSEMSLTFKLRLPEPCNGDFSDGSIFFWGEAV